MDRITPAQRSAVMSKIRGANTAPEITVRKLLHQMGFRFRLHRTDLPGTPDIVLPRYKTVIFVHGCFWHRHTCLDGRRIPQTRSDYWQNKFDRNKKRDRRTIREIKRLGWNVLVIWECQTKPINFHKLENKLYIFLSDK